MRPLDPLRERGPIARLLMGAPAAEARAELARLDAEPLAGAEAAARAFARGALMLREGELDPAHRAFDESAAAYAALGEVEASELARCEGWVAAIRRGPRAVYAEAIAALGDLAGGAAARARVLVVATHYRGTAERFAGDAIAAQRTLLAAFARSEPFLEERAQILNSLGTLYVVLGAFGAAEAMLEHAAELHHRSGDAIGEAIAFGQLGAAALARGELERARTYLQKQEWLATRVGDSFGRARALTFLADVAIEVGRPDDALALATQAREVAGRVSPPLGLWIAYATRAIGRAKVELGDPGARQELESAIERFAKIGNALGDALARWDLARLERAELAPAASAGARRAPASRDGGARWFSAAWAFASLGLASRVAQLLADRRPRDDDGGALFGPAEEVIAAAAQGFPHLGVAQELALVYGAPERLAAIAARRTAAQRNLGRLAALSIAEPGLVVAAIAAGALGAAGGQPLALPPQRASAACVGEIPGACVWAWRAAAPIAEVARDLAALRAAAGEDARAVVAVFPAARVASAPFAGEVGAGLEGVEAAGLVAEAASLAPAALVVRPGLAWPPDADALAKMAGYTPTVP